jgi:hypothetical protein
MMAFVFNKLNNVTGNQPRVQDMLAGGGQPAATQEAPVSAGNKLSAASSTGISGSGQLAPEQAGATKFQSPTALLESGQGMGGKQVAEVVGKKAEEAKNSIDEQANTYVAGSKQKQDAVAGTQTYIDTGVGDATALKSALNATPDAAPELNYDTSSLQNVGNRAGREAFLTQGRQSGYTGGMKALDSALLGRAGLDANATNAVNSVPVAQQAAVQKVGEAKGQTQAAIDAAKKLVTDKDTALRNAALDNANKINKAAQDKQLSDYANTTNPINDMKLFAQSLSGALQGALKPVDPAKDQEYTSLLNQIKNVDPNSLDYAPMVQRIQQLKGELEGSYGWIGPGQSQVENAEYGLVGANDIQNQTGGINYINQYNNTLKNLAALSIPELQQFDVTSQDNILSQDPVFQRLALLTGNSVTPTDLSQSVQKGLDPTSITSSQTEFRNIINALRTDPRIMRIPGLASLLNSAPQFTAKSFS